MPVAERGRGGRSSKYNLEECQAWQKARNATAVSGSTPFSEVNRERARKERAQAQLAEQAFLIKAGELLPLDAVEKRWSAEIVALRAKLLAWKRSQVAEQLFRTALVDGQGAFDDLLSEAIDELLRDLSVPDSVKKKKRRTAA